MTMVRWSPRLEMEPFTRDPFFRRVLDVLNEVDLGPNGERNWYPSIDLVEENERLIAHVELPGIDPKDVHVSLKDELLTVHGERKGEFETEKAKFLKREQIYGAFTRTLLLPCPVQVERVTAQYKSGIMIITMPKAKGYVGREIKVQAEE